MKQYEKYKPSGVEWIGEMPEHWDCLRIGRLSSVKRGASPRPIDDPKYFDNDGDFAWVRIADVSASERYLEATTQTLSELGSSLSVKRYPGDFFLSIAGSVGKPIITKIKCCIHDGFVWFPNLRVNPEYLYYIFSTGLPYQGLGKWGTQLNLNTDTVSEISIPLPQSKEIEEIVQYLDNKTSQIDILIAQKQRLIELLNEEKTAVINHAVTKGLNPDAPMKDSGIQWLGNLPSHWELKKLKFLGDIKYGLGTPPKLKMDGLRLIRATDIQRGEIVDSETVFVDPTDVPYDRDPILRENDIVVVRSGAYTGDSAIINREYDGSIIGYDMVVRVSQANSSFISYCLLSHYVLNQQIYMHRLRAAQPHLNREELGETLILVPGDEEQKELSNFIRERTVDIKRTIDRIKREIELLEEYRTALISEVVTGKIRIYPDTVETISQGVADGTLQIENSSAGLH